MATRPRQVLPGRTLLITGRAVHREHRFAPRRDVVHAIRFCLATTLQEYHIELHAFVWLSNHYHLVLTDVDAQLPDFMRDLNSLISKALNALRGFRGENFARRSYNTVVATDEEAILRHCGYVEANPCAANLVRYATQWDSVSSAGMTYGEELLVRRPDIGLWGDRPADTSETIDPTRSSFRGKTNCPETAVLKLTRPPCWKDQTDTQVRQEVQRQVKEREYAARDQRKQEDSTVLGMTKARRTHFRSAASSKEAYFNSEPQASGSDPNARKAILAELRNFVSTYRDALARLKAGEPTCFPEGTWWMHRHYTGWCAVQSP